MQEIDPNKALVLKLTKAGDVIYPERQMELPEPTWPLGTQGALTILNGETIQVMAGSVLDYSSIDIQAGGVLEIVGLTLDITYIGCTGNVTIDGELRARNYLGNEQQVYGYINKESLSWKLTQANGGNGGRTFTPEGWYANSVVVSKNGFGSGGSGGLGANVCNWVGNAGQSGGSNNQAGTNSPAGRTGGAGNITLGNGSNGLPAPAANAGGLGGSGGGSGGGAGSWVGFYYNEAAGGGGGGGGMKGKHGLPIYIYCLGSITGAGVINLSGSNGFAGGNGGNAFVNNYGGNCPRGAGGAGGGGGAGGSGGYLWVRHGDGFSVPYNISNGTGGAAGVGGQGKIGSPAIPSGGANLSPTNDSQTSGTSGLVGNVDIKQI